MAGGVYLAVAPAGCSTAGMGWWYRKYANEQSPEDQGRYEFAEQEAKAKKAGLWQDKNPTPLWEFRRGTR
jgi:endonuclease YncB( thermonuclease family)